MLWVGRIMISTIGLLFFLLLVELLMISSDVSPSIFARPSEVFLVISKFFFGGEYSEATLGTLRRSVLAFILAVPCGILLGVLVAKVRTARGVGSFLIDFMRSIPATALVPLFIVIFGIGDESKIFAGFFSAFLTIAMSVVIGFDKYSIDRSYIASKLNMDPLKRVVLIDLPEISGSLFVGLRSAVSLALILVVVSEMFNASSPGLGSLIYEERYGDKIPTLYAAIVVSGILGYLMNLAVASVEKFLKRFLYIGVQY